MLLLCRPISYAIRLFNTVEIVSNMTAARCMEHDINNNFSPKGIGFPLGNFGRKIAGIIIKIAISIKEPKENVIKSAENTALMRVSTNNVRYSDFMLLLFSMIKSPFQINIIILL